jgi:predicted nucleic acid-binding protein
MDVSLAIEFYKNYNIKFIDALIASNPKIFKKEITIISYDKDFDKINVLRKEPKEILKEI